MYQTTHVFVCCAGEASYGAALLARAGWQQWQQQQQQKKQKQQKVQQVHL